MVNPKSPSPPGSPGQGISRSTLFPVLGNMSGFARKTQLLPIVATILAGLAIGAAFRDEFNFLQIMPGDYNHIFQIFWIVAAYITFLVVYSVYMLCGREKPLWLLISVFLVMAVLFWGPLGHLAGLYDNLFTGDLKQFSNSASLLSRIFASFFGPGIGEEFVKAIPVAVLAGVGLFWTGPRTRQIGVCEPLDGILIGVVSAAAFALTETMQDYVGGAINDVLQPLYIDGLQHFCQHALNSTIPVVTDDCKKQALAFALQNGEDASSFLGLYVILSRGLPGVAGHIAYSGVFGYFIGLAALRPASAPRLVLTGWISAMVLHGAWDAVNFSERYLGEFATGTGSFLIALFSYFYLGSVILKARQISPTRKQNFAAFGDSVVASVGSASQPLAPQPHKPQPYPPQPKQQPGPATGVNRPHAKVAQPKQASIAALVIKIGPVTRVVAEGTTIEPIHLGRHGAGRGKGAIAEVVANPTEPGIFGLRNLSDRVYRAKQPNGNVIDVHRGDLARLAPGIVIDFGGIEGAVQSK